MDIEKRVNADQSASFERKLVDDSGRIVCTCDGTANKVFSCLKLSSVISVTPGDDEHYEGVDVGYGDEGFEIDYGVHELTTKMWECSREGIRNVTNGFTQKREFRRAAAVLNSERPPSPK